MNNADRKALVKQTMERIVQVDKTVISLVGMVDLGVSNVYDNGETIEMIEILSNSLGQMDSDLAVLVNLLDTDQKGVFKMARKKAKAKDYKYINCTNEAIGIAKKWFRDNRIPLHAGSLYIVWFAYTKNGYRCMVQSN